MRWRNNVLGSVQRLAGQDVLEFMDLHGAGVTVLLVEQNASLALQIADRGYVLEAGRLSISGPAAQLLTDERVRRAYLG